MNFVVLIALIVLAPLPLGSVVPVAWGLMASVVALMVLARGVNRILADKVVSPNPARLWNCVFPVGLLAGWVAIQSASFVPTAWHHAWWRGAAIALEADIRPTITLDAFETGSALARLLCYAGVFWLAVDYGRERRRAHLILRTVMLSGLAYASYGLAVEFIGEPTVLWFEKSAYRADLTSTFINRNSYSTFAGLGLLCCTAVLVQQLSGLAWSRRRWRARAGEILVLLTERSWLVVVAWATLATALLLSHSRGGFLSTALGITAMLVAFGFSHGARKRYVLAASFPILAVSLAVFLYSGERTSARLARAAMDSDLRVHLYELSIEAIMDRPLLGSGYGTFADVFRAYRDAAFGKSVVMAHNSYLETALELGLPGAILLVFALGAVFLRCVIGIRARRRDVIYPCIGVGATVLVAAHTLVDFSLQIPAVAVTYAAIMGIAVAQSQRRQAGSSDG